MKTSTGKKLLRLTLHVLCCLPAVWLFYLAASDGLGALGPAFTTAPGAVDPSAAQAPVAQAPEAPDLSTPLGAGVPRDGVPFTRDIATSGLAVEDRGAMERARAAMVDYQPGDTTHQWETSMGATAARQGLDMPAPEFDTGALGLESQGRALTPSERMGINPAAGALSRAAAVAVDSGATPVQFLGATGRDLQARATGPGVTNESNVIDVQGRLVEDRAISTPRRLTDQQDGMAARADKQVFGSEGNNDALVPEVRATVAQLNGLLADTRTSLKKVDAVLVEAQAIGANAREATTDLGALRAEVESNLRKVESLVNEINRKWPFARDTELKLP